VDSVVDTFTDFELFNPTNKVHLTALNERLNQNYFVGLAAKRISRGQVEYLYGESVWEGILSLVPRIVWPEKPVFAGSPQIVCKMTGLRLSPKASFGVGNVMEFQINFGTPGVAVGFMILGWAIGILDLKAANAERNGDLGNVILCFFPAVALINPQGSLVEMLSGAAASLIAAFLWSLLWKRIVARNVKVPRQIRLLTASKSC
jgi:hypothetical protein